MALAVLALGVVPPLACRLPARLDGRSRRFRLLAIVWIFVAVAAVAQIGRLAFFMDVPARGLFVLPSDPFWRIHWCLSAYFMAADRGRAGDYEVYEMPAGVASRYEAVLAPAGVDDFLSPPTLLVLPGLGLALSDDVFVYRRSFASLSEPQSFWLHYLQSSIR